MIEARGVTKAFDGKRVLQGIDAVFEPGKTNLIIGQSGSGKTVFLKVLVGLLRPDAGVVLFEGEDVVSMGIKERRHIQQRIGMLFQNAALFDSQSVLENVMFPLVMFGKMTRRQALQRAMECLERVHLMDAVRLMPSDLSGGMRKRVAIARAIALQPEFLFCDEPNSGLDPQTSLVIDELIHDITREFSITTVVNTHDMNSVLGIGDTVSFLYKGRVAWRGTNKEVLSSGNTDLNNFVFATPMAKRLKQDRAEQ